MSGRLRVTPGALEAASAVWQDQGERLFGARRDLYHGDPAQLGDRVAPVAAEFLAHWERQLSGLVGHAERHADALHLCALTFGATDDRTAGEMQRLLPYGAPALGGER